MGKMFDVIISSTGKHYLIGEVLQDSLSYIPPRPTPLPYGTVSGTCPTLPIVRLRRDAGSLQISDSLLLVLAFCIVCVAVWCHYSQIVSVFR